ncbi:MAG: HAD family phosphatase [Lachnospiraceae bacterium]|nr:HAD family phosphatase [Lachnospiraceae bacterium]
MIKNIVFDIGNVLVEFGWKPYFDKFNLTPEEFERLVNATVKSNVWNEMDRGAVSEEEILNAYIANDPGIEDIIRAIYADFHDMLKQYDYTKDWIKSLQAEGFKVYCLSNMSHKSVRENADALDFIPLTDGTILSCDYNIIKPEKAIYDLLFDKFNLIPSECVFIDDVKRNIDKAKELGMYGIVFESKAQVEEEIKRLKNTVK